MNSGVNVPERHVIIMGIRGVPAAHGGFETFAEHLALYLVEQGWKVTVYCQGSPDGRRSTDVWKGVSRIHIPVSLDGAPGTIEFDAKATLDVLSLPGTILTLGYNTGFLCTLLAAKRRTNIINMDGLEWKRAKYGTFAKIYLWLNERLAIWSGTHLIADHPVIADHLASRTARSKITTIPYGAPEVRESDAALVSAFNVTPYKYLTVIARIEPENSILEIVRSFSAKKRGVNLLVLGKFDPDHAYQKTIMDEASDEVIFPGPVYEKSKVQALRFYSLAYVHGHQVGGTNPSLVEALGAGNAILAHDNPFNRWVAGEAGLYFGTEEGLNACMDQLLSDPALQETKRMAARRRWQDQFTWQSVLDQYRTALEAF